jgi:hypothetical protein
MPTVCEGTFGNDSGSLPTSLEGPFCQGVTTGTPLATIADDSQNLALEVVKFQSSQDHATDILPRPKRRHRRASADRGLPADEELANLARAYLDRQRKHWPKMAEAGLLPVPDEKIVPMVEDFKERHRTGKVEIDAILAFQKFCEKFGGGYERYSCDNSIPMSILDQMINILDKARADDCFIPWQYLFADFSISGLDASRQGYGSYKFLLADKDHIIQVTFVDDFTRASRDELEWWRLAALSKRLGKGMIGASDGFDLSDPNSDILITVFGLVSRLFIKGIREKVRRGMKGAARRGTCLGKLPLGFTRQICRDVNGEIIRRPDGRPRHKPCIDPATKPYRVEMLELFVHKSWSPYKIARHFNQLRVDGSDGWTGSSVKKLLAGIDAIGIFVWNRCRREYNYEEKKWETIKNPRSERTIYKDPNLALIPKGLWRAAWLKLLKTRKASPLTGKKQSRNQNSATTLFSGTLIGDHCNDELRLNRSVGTYKVMSCLSGSTGVHDCPLTSSKSAQIIEDCLLGYIGNSILTEKVILGLIEKANIFLEQEARMPRVDAEPMKSKVRDYTARIKKLVEKVEKEPDEELCEAYRVHRHDCGIEHLRHAALADGSRLLADYGGMILSGRYWTWEKITLIFCVVNLIYIPAAFLIHPSVRDIFRYTFIPTLPPGGFTNELFFMLMANIGTTPDPLAQ